MSSNAPRVLTEPQQLALDTILQKPARGIGIWEILPMEWVMIDRIAGFPEGTYQKDPASTCRKMLENSGVCMVDQWIPDNPLSMGRWGFEGTAERKATTGVEEIVCDGIPIREPEDTVRHFEKVVFPNIRKAIAEFDADARIRGILENEAAVQQEMGPLMLKAPYGIVSFPYLDYYRYGYRNYFSAYALYPEVMEQCFKLQADLALLNNGAAARAYIEGQLPPLCRLDHDIADTRGILVNVRSLDRLWFPHFARCLEPLLKAGVRLIWHCDGNLMDMVPRLLDVGLCGFQGFQYEHGMDYEKICKMRTRDGGELFIIAGVSVTRTLPFGTPEDVRREMRYLVEHGPKRGLFLACSSSITPGVPWENLKALVDGLWHYREHGRAGIQTS